MIVSLRSVMSSTANPGSAPTSTAAASATPSLQPTLKVMRLYKPRLYTQGATAGSMMPTALAETSALQHEFAMSSMLILPDSFGEIFLGNTFSSFISVINQYACDIRDVGLTANIQCANERVDLHDNRYARTGKLPPANPMKVLQAGASLDMVVDYPLNQVGNHVLRVGVTYTDPFTNEPKSLRKFYRFGVQNPLVITFKQALLGEDSLVEAQIRNVSKIPLFVDSIKFLTVLPFQAQTFEEESAENQNEASLDDLEVVTKMLERGPQSLLNPQEELQRVFRISYDPTADPSVIAMQQASQNLGRLHVGWKSAVGEAGSVQSQPLMRKMDPRRDVTVKLENLPDEIYVGVPILATVTVENQSSHNLQLQIQFRKDSTNGIYCSSLSHQNLGLVAAKSSQSVEVEFLPTVGSLQSIQGVVCVDLRTGQEFEQDVLAQVMVHAVP